MATGWSVAYSTGCPAYTCPATIMARYSSNSRSANLQLNGCPGKVMSTVNWVGSARTKAVYPSVHARSVHASGNTQNNWGQVSRNVPWVMAPAPVWVIVVAGTRFWGLVRHSLGPAAIVRCQYGWWSANELRCPPSGCYQLITLSNKGNGRPWQAFCSG